MDKETYEALKKVMELARWAQNDRYTKSIERLDNWMSAVEKHHGQHKDCDYCIEYRKLTL